ncbi:MAG TPA: CHAD domain-containing protein [Terriglobales bacterium]|jgi:CHAD domain-containing protein|nr:CHAD domain-containing protein [Terriglobales bacterium]
MPVISKAAKDEFHSPPERLLASIANLRQQPTSKGAHFYRTSLRRFQAWNDVSHPHIDPEQQQALKFLDRLRKATGKLRDTEIHLELLENLAGVRSAEKTKLKKERKTRRKSYRKKLKSLLRDSILSSISRALRVLNAPQAQAKEPRPMIDDSTKLALQEYRAFVQQRGPLSPENLHEYRLECKRFRYTAELAGETPEGEILIAAWKGVQDVIGEWHDYLTLSEVAQEVLGDSPLHTKLLERTQKKYQESLRAVANCEQKLLIARGPVPKKEPRRARSGRSSSQAA